MQLWPMLHTPLKKQHRAGISLVGGFNPLKYIGQLGLLFPIYGKIKNVPNHQPDQISFFVVSSNAEVGNHHGNNGTF